MHNPARRAAALALALATLAWPHGITQATSLDAGPTHIIAFSDSRPVPGASWLSTELSSAHSSLCGGTMQPAQPVPLASSVAATIAFLRATSATGMALVAASPYARREGAALALAAAATVRGEPDLALATLLRAHQLAPRDPWPLLDAVPALVQLGRASDALSFVDGAAALPAPAQSPFGTPWAAQLAAARGLAFLGLNRWADAADQLTMAVAQAPLLTEADLDLAHALECQGRHAGAVRYLSAGFHRQQWGTMDIIGGGGDPWRVQPGEVFDQAHGTAALTLPTLDIPTTPTAAEALFLPTHRYATGEMALRNQAAVSREIQDETRLRATFAHMSPATRQRTIDVLAAVDQVPLEADVKPLAARTLAAQQAVAAAVALTSAGGIPCGDQGAAMGHIVALELAYSTLERRYAGTVYARQVALAANLRNPLAHQVALDKAAMGAAMAWGLLVTSDLPGPIDYGHFCFDRLRLTPEPPAEQPASGSVSLPQSGPCGSQPEFAPDLSLKLGVVSVTANCEEVGIEAETDTPLLGAFGRVSRSMKDGSTTVFVGGEAGGSTPGPIGAGATARSGIYVTVDNHGNVKDYGMRFDAATTVNAGTLTNYQGDSMTFSLVGVSPIAALTGS